MQAKGGARDYLLYVDIKTSRPPTRLLTVELFKASEPHSTPLNSLIVAEDPEAGYERAVTDKFFADLHRATGLIFQDDLIESTHPEWNRVAGFISELPFVDLRLLMRIFFPNLSVSNLAGFSEAFSVANNLPTASKCLILHDMIVQKACSLPGSIQRQLKSIFRGLPAQYESWLNQASTLSTASAPEVREEFTVNLERFQNLTSGNAIPPDELPALFKGTSAHIKDVKDFEVRRGQAIYSQKVLDNLARGGVSLVEAATGTGKSIGYLLPLISFCNANNERGVVVTRTKSLQEQLFRSDLVKISRLIPDGMQISILKGLANYLCLLRYKVFISELAEQMGRYPAEALAALAVWEHDTKSGDLTETSIFESGGADRLMFRVTVDEGSCLRRNCQFYNDCYGFKARRQAVKSQVVITNYALLFSDLVSNAELLGKTDHIIFDEAHRIQAEAVNAFSETVPLQSLSRWLERISGEKFRGFLKASLEIEDEDGFEIVDFCNQAAALSDAIKVLYQEIKTLLEKTGREPGSRIRFQTGDRIHQSIAACVEMNRDSLQSIRAVLADLQQSPPGDSGDSSETDLEGVTSFRRVVTIVINYIETLLRLASAEPQTGVRDASDGNLVFWALAGSNGDVFITVAPVEVGGLLVEQLYPRYRSLLFTSATLDSEDDFGWIKTRLGLSDAGDLDVNQFKLPSPFPLAEQLRVMLARFLPPPNHPDYVKRLGKMLNRIIRKNSLPTLVLCTSYRMVEQLAEIMGKNFDPSNLIVQNSEVPAQSLLNRFRRQKRGVLIGTESFWEGIDLPGDLLRLLILTRMPFAVPDDPLEQARQEKAIAAGENAFMTISIPAAVLKYRQGMGRMIRSESDWGVVVITDSRMGRKRYGQIFMAASPVDVEICDQEQNLIKGVYEWFEQHQRA